MVNGFTKRMRIVYIVLTAVSGPVVNIFVRQLHMTPDEGKLWLDLVAACTMAIGLGWGVSASSNTGMSTALQALPPEDRKDVIDQMPPMQKAEILDSVPTSMKVASISQSPMVSKIVVKDYADGKLSQMAQDDEQPKVMTETEDKKP